ncbi:hypothetical protein AAG570_000951 [Ranatra chinensis]|uniref:DDE-1 domain-containing protein n=1 Tax=Ranatra chinensis TaxID=642074 RepID=A0ABD0YYU7_9HEMI
MKSPFSTRSGATEPVLEEMLTIQEKVRLLDMITKKIMEVARHFNLNESTVRYIRKEEKNIRATATDEPHPESSSTMCADFTASKGWFEKFQKRYQLKSVVLHGEAVSADQSAAEDYVNKYFQTILEESEYHPEQVFNMDETGLFWKKIPSRTFIFKDEAKVRGFKAYKDHVTHVICGNAEEFLLKPALIYKAKNPRALKNKNKNLLPVHWMVKSYLEEKGLEIKVLLLMDNAGGHAQELSYEGVRIEFLPPNTTSLIQPMDLKDMKVETAKASWKELPPGIVHESEELTPEEVNSAVDNTVRLAQMLEGEGFQDMNRADVFEVLETSDPLNDEDLVELAKTESEEEAEELPEVPEEEVGPTLERLSIFYFLLFCLKKWVIRV